MPSPVTHNPAKYFALAPPPRCLCTVYAASPRLSSHCISRTTHFLISSSSSRLSPKAQKKIEVGYEKYKYFPKIFWWNLGPGLLRGWVDIRLSASRECTLHDLSSATQTQRQAAWQQSPLQPDLVTGTRESPRSAFSVASSFLCLDVVLYNRVDIV